MKAQGWSRLDSLYLNMKVLVSFQRDNGEKFTHAHTLTEEEFKLVNTFLSIDREYFKELKRKADLYDKPLNVSYLSKRKGTDGFDWDSFLKDYQKFSIEGLIPVSKLSLSMGVNRSYLSSLKSGALKRVGRQSLDRILAGMDKSFDFYYKEL